jgi:hypothetical protein
MATRVTTLLIKTEGTELSERELERVGRAA